MKKMTLLLACVLSVLSMSAQTEHMKFAGIPLDGTIDQFQQKLLDKGYTLNKEMSHILPSGIRAYTGVFIGEDANIAIYYDEGTQNVYSGKAFFENLSESDADDRFAYVKSLLIQKYPDKELNEEDRDGLKYLEIMTDLGIIQVYQQKREDLRNYPYHYIVHVHYYDGVNNAKHRNSVLDDL